MGKWKLKLVTIPVVIKITGIGSRSAGIT